MKIRLLSDLHLEFHPFTIPELPDDRDTVLVLAGDIAPINRRTLLSVFLRDAAEQFKAVCLVPGNHEYYGGTWPRAINKLREWKLPGNIHVLDRSSVELDDVVFLGATLWTDMDRGNPRTETLARSYMNDYSAILVGPAPDPFSGPVRLSPDRTMEDHARSRQWIESSLRELHEAGQKTVLITHHGVTHQSIHPKYEGNALNGAFVSDLSDILLQYPPALVTHGHVHSSLSYQVAGHGPRVVANPRGYTRTDLTQENPDFDARLVLSV